MEPPQKRQVTYDETLIERTMSTLINGSMALQLLPHHTPTQRPADAYTFTSPQIDHGRDRPQPHRPDTSWQPAQPQRPDNSWHRPQPNRPDNSWQPAQTQRPDNSWHRPQPNRPDNSWRPEQPQRPDHQTTAYDQYQPHTQDRPYAQNRTFPYQPPHIEQADEHFHA